MKFVADAWIPHASTRFVLRQHDMEIVQAKVGSILPIHQKSLLYNIPYNFIVKCAVTRNNTILESNLSEIC